MSTSIAATGYIAPLPETKPEAPSYLRTLATKVCNFVTSRWAIIVIAGLLSAGAATAIAAMAFSLAIAPAIGCGVIVGGAAAYLANRLKPEALQALRVFSLNFLGSLSDPFEFAGDYGEFINGVKQEVNDCLIGHATGKKKVTKEDIAHDVNYGPKLNEIMTPELWEEIKTQAQKNGLDMGNLANVQKFLAKYQDKKLFYYFRNCDEAFLGLDLNLRKVAGKSADGFTLPIVSSPAQIPGANVLESKQALASVIFTAKTKEQAKGIAEENVKLTPKTDPKNPAKVLQQPDAKVVAKITKNHEDAAAAFKKCVGRTGNPDDRGVFATPEGEMVFYFLYQAMNLQLLSEVNGLTERVNQAKAEFADTMGDPVRRAECFAKKFEKAGADVVCVQECSSTFTRAMAERGYVSTEQTKVDGKWKTHSKDGSVIFLNTKTMKRKFELLPATKVDNHEDTKLVEIIAKRKGTNQPVFIFDFHGSASNAKQARDFISHAKESFENADLPDNALFVGAGDANPKNAEEMEELGEHIDEEGCQATNVGDTSMKERELTPQHSKTWDAVSMPKDLIVTLKKSQMRNQTANFRGYQMPKGTKLPNTDVGSDHVPVGVEIS